MLSSRPVGYTSPGGNFKEYTLKPFERPEEALPYLQGWLAILKPEWEDAAARAKVLLDEMVANPALKRLTDNPLLLRLAAEVYAVSGKLAGNRAELYRRYVEEAAWQRRDELRRIPEEQKRAILDQIEDLAWALQAGEKPSLPKDELALLREKLGLIIRWQEDGEQRLAFSHKTFQEYFVARRLAKAWKEKTSRKRIWKILRPRLHDPAWREPLLLLAGSLDPEGAADLIRRVCKARSRYERRLHRDVRLAAILASELKSKNLPGALLDALIRKLREHLHNRNAYQMWQAQHALSKLGAYSIPILLQALEDKDEWVRFVAAKALGQINDPQAIYILMQALDNEDWTIRQAAAKALGRIGDPQAIPALQHVLEDENEYVRLAAAGALGQIGQPALPALQRALEDENWSVRQVAAEALGQTGDPQAGSALQWALEDEDWSAGEAADGTLEQIGYPQTVLAQQWAMENEHWSVRQAAAKFLGKNRDPQAIPVLLRALEDKFPIVRQVAAKALGRIGDPQAIPTLQRVLEDERGDELGLVRSAAAWALGQISDPRALPALLRALEDENENVYRAAAEALERMSVKVREQIVLRSIAAALFRAREWRSLEPVLACLEALQAPPLRNPLFPSPPFPWHQCAARFAQGMAWVSLIVLAGFALLFSDVLGDLLKESWKVGLQAWAAAHPLGLFLLVGGLILLGGLLAWGADAVREAIKK